MPRYMFCLFYNQIGLVSLLSHDSQLRRGVHWQFHSCGNCMLLAAVQGRGSTLLPYQKTDGSRSGVTNLSSVIQGFGSHWLLRVDQSALLAQMPHLHTRHVLSPICYCLLTSPSHPCATDLHCNWPTISSFRWRRISERWMQPSLKPCGDLFQSPTYT